MPDRGRGRVASVALAAGSPTNSVRVPEKSWREHTSTALCGGSLGSCVDEERSQLRELM